MRLSVFYFTLKRFVLTEVDAGTLQSKDLKVENILDVCVCVCDVLEQEIHTNKKSSRTVPYREMFWNSVKEFHSGEIKCSTNGALPHTEQHVYI